MKKWLSNLLSEGNEVSSKRVIAILGSLVLLGVLIANSLTNKDIAPSDALVNAALVLTLGCFGFTSIDKFAK